MTVGSLFAGIGGIDIAFKQAGFDIKWAIEKDSACCKTYANNFSETKLIQCDIHNVATDELPKVDVITAGFPCQSFSIAGKQRGFSDPRGNSFFEIKRFIMHSKPRFVFLENVPNLLEHDNGKTFNIIHNTLSELDYTIRYRVLLASEYGGIPQIRNRIYIVAFREQEDCDNFNFPSPIKLKFTIEDILKRSTRKHRVYYYSDDDQFFKFAKQIVKRMTLYIEFTMTA
jgi:DNA (cytosine-5)-methyltransferase 1